MATIYDYDLHGLGEAAFRSIQRQAFMGESAPAAQVERTVDGESRWSWWAIGMAAVGTGVGACLLIRRCRKES